MSGLLERTGVDTGPLSFAQERLWFLDQLSPGSSAYHVPYITRLRGPLDLDALHRALVRIVDRHESLRTRLCDQRGRPFQEVPKHWPTPALHRRDLSGEREPEEAARRQVRADVRAPFSLGDGDLVRAFTYRLGAEDHVLCVNTHHVATDGWSLAILAAELSALYADERAASVPPLPVQYIDYAIWQRDQLATAGLARDIEYWTAKLDGLAEWPLPGAAVRRPGEYVTTKRREVLPRELTRAVRRVSRKAHATTFMTLLAAFQATLGLWAGRHDVAVGSPVASRSHRLLEPLIGLFINMVVLRTDLTQSRTFTDLVADVRRTTLEALTYQRAPFEAVVREIGAARSACTTPLFNAVFVLHNMQPPELQLPGIRTELFPVDTAIVRFDLELHAYETGDQIVLFFIHDPQVLDESVGRDVAQRHRTFLARVCDSPDEPFTRGKAGTYGHAVLH